MRFGENSRKGASSLIVVMFVAVIALAGTAVYVALDRTVLTTDGYALPGSTISYDVKDTTGTEDDSATMTVFGFDDGAYIMGEMPIQSPFVNTLEVFDIPNVESIEGMVDVPGLGRTPSTTYSFNTTDSMGSMTINITITMTTILHGLPFSYTMTGSSGTLSETLTLETVSSDIIVGNYASQASSERFTGSVNQTITVDRISESIDGNYIYHIQKSNDDVESYYYIGNSVGVPQYLPSSTTSCKEGSVTLYFDNTGLTRIYWNGDYLPISS